MFNLLQDASVWVAISFALFAALALKKALPSFLAKLDGRIEQIRSEIKTAHTLKEEAAKLLSTYERKRDEAAREAQEMAKTARMHADQIRQQADAELSELVSRREEQLQTRLRRMEEAVAADIRAYAAELAVQATARIISEKMDEKTNARLIEESIRRVAGQGG